MIRIVMPINPDLLITSPTLQCPYVDKLGNPLTNGTLFLFQDNSRTTFKNWYYQSGTIAPYAYIPLPNPMTLSAAGTPVDVNGNDILPMYYPVSETDNTTPQLYFVQAFDQFRTLQWTRENFPFEGINNEPTTTTNSTDNIIINNRFWRNQGITLTGSAQTPLPLNTYTTQYNNSGNSFYYATLAPSQHDGFSMPDFIYIKNNINAVETISFNKFSATTINSLSNDVIPEFYVNHNCTAAATGETLKCYQFPISLHVDSISNQIFSFTIQAQSVTGSAQIVAYLYQYLGAGAANSQGTFIGSGIINLTTAWEKFTLQGFFPGDQGLITSNTGDDAYYLQIAVPMNQVFELNFALPSIYLSNIIPVNDFKTYDQIDSVIGTPRTGDIRTSLNSFFFYGWVPMNNGTIGNALSNADSRANADTWQLFNLIWNIFNSFPVGITQLFNSSGAPVSSTGTGLGDFNANYSLQLTKMMGQVILGTVPLSALLPVNSTSSSIPGYSATVTVTSNIVTATTGTLNYFNGMPVCFIGTTTLSTTTIYYVTAFNGTNAFSLSTTFAQAITGTPNVTVVSDSGKVFSAEPGAQTGEYAHALLASQLAAHTHPTTNGSSFVNNSASSTAATGGNVSIYQGLELTTGSNTGTGTPFNVTQPGTFYNIFIKL
jgi:hypothetical protein